MVRNADLTGATLESAQITRREARARCKTCGAALDSGGQCEECKKQALNAAAPGRRSQPIYLALYLSLLAGPVNFVLTPLFAAAQALAPGKIHLLAGGALFGLTVSLVSLVLGFATANRRVRRERDLFNANTLLAALNLVVIAAAALLLRRAGLTLGGF